jgi:hypothetical protein
MVQGSIELFSKAKGFSSDRSSQQLMKSLAIGCIILILLAAQGSASLAMYEAGKAVICIDDDFEMDDSKLSLLEMYPTIYFEPISSREDVRNNNYNLIFTDIGILSKSDFATVFKPIRIMISDQPFDPVSTFTFKPTPAKNITVGKLGLVNTTLYSGSWEKQTPHFVTFTEGNFSCCIYGQDIDQEEMEDFLKRIDVVNKSDLAIYLPSLWTE